MDKEIIIALAKVAIIGAAVVLACPSNSHGQNKANELKQRIHPQAQSLGQEGKAHMLASYSDYRAIK